MSEELDGTEATISDQTELDTLREGIDDPSVLKAQLAKEAEARRQIHARALKAETELKALKSQPPKEKEVERAQPSTVIDEAVDLRLDGYSKSEVDFILKNGGRKAIEDPNSFVSLAIKTHKEQQRAEQEASKTSTSGGTETVKGYTPEQIANMSAKELEKLLPRV